MQTEIKIPSPGESINEVILSRWHVANGDFVKKDQEIAEIESEKASLSILSPSNGIVHILVPEGSAVAPGSVACTLEEKDIMPTEQKEELKITVHSKLNNQAKEIKDPAKTLKEAIPNTLRLTPVAQQMAAQEGLGMDDILRGLKKLGKAEMKMLLNSLDKDDKKAAEPVEKKDKRLPMSPLRKKLSQRLVKAKNETAMLTTFNEVDMGALMALREKHQSEFQKVHGIKLGYMSFFTKAVTLALKEFPVINSMLDGDDIIEFESCHIGIAVQTPKGLMVPVIRNADTLNLSQLEKQIFAMAQKARDLKISPDDLTGAGFTITNGGVFGSLLSTPILNHPQAAILGMHSIVDRPMAVKGKVEIRPMMYLALSYDHRLIDGRDSVGFLLKIKERIENPLTLLLEGNAEQKLLGL